MNKNNGLIGTALAMMFSAGIIYEPDVIIVDPYKKRGNNNPENRKPPPRKEPPPPKGLKQFFYGDNTLWALNQSNADRKAKKMGWI